MDTQQLGDPILDRCYIVNVVDHDYSSLVQYSKQPFVHITEGYVSTQSWDRVTHTLGVQILDSVQQDYLVMSGMNSLCGITVALWMKKHNVCRLLLWDKKMLKYRLKVIDSRPRDEQ